ncbi:MAG: DMT family transporter [Burkholderiaceae bacterium]|nr:DMT family transporter [Burkholderiaceae bacterium]
MRFALALFIAGGFCLSSLDALGKVVMSQTGLALLIWARYMGQVLFSLPLSFHYAGPRFWKTSKPKLQLLRSTLLVCTSLLFFGGVQFLPLAEASAIAFTAPIWVAILSGPMLGERVARSDWAVAAIGFSGILLIVRPGTEIFHFGALLIGGMAAVNAVYQLLTRKLTQDSPFTTFFYSGLVGAAGFTVWFLFAGFPEMPDVWTVIQLCGVGLLGGLGHLLFVLAFYRASPASLTPFVYMQMVWAIGFGWLLFRQLPDGWALLGMAVIIASGLWLILHHHRQRARRSGTG